MGEMKYYRKNTGDGPLFVRVDYDGPYPRTIEVRNLKSGEWVKAPHAWGYIMDGDAFAIDESEVTEPQST